MQSLTKFRVADALLNILSVTDFKKVGRKVTDKVSAGKVMFLKAMKTAVIHSTQQLQKSDFGDTRILR